MLIKHFSYYDCNKTNKRPPVCHQTADSSLLQQPTTLFVLTYAATKAITLFCRSAHAAAAQA